jgi:PKD repeat protein
MRAPARCPAAQQAPRHICLAPARNVRHAPGATKLARNQGRFADARLLRVSTAPSGRLAASVALGRGRSVALSIGPGVQVRRRSLSPVPAPPDDGRWVRVSRRDREALFAALIDQLPARPSRTPRSWRLLLSALSRSLAREGRDLPQRELRQSGSFGASGCLNTSSGQAVVDQPVTVHLREGDSSDGFYTIFDYYTLRWGDDSQPDGGVSLIVPPGQEAAWSHVYSEPGVYELTMTWSGALYHPSSGIYVPCAGTDRLTVVVTDPNPRPVVPTVSIRGDNAVLDEWDEGSQRATFTVFLSSPTTVPVSVTVSTGDPPAAEPGGAATPGAHGTKDKRRDYCCAGSFVVTFAPGQAVVGTLETVFGDHIVERPRREAFQVTLSSPVNATLGVSSVIGAIHDDDLPPVARFKTTTRSGGIVEFDAGDSEGHEGAIVDYVWGFGDGHTHGTAEPSTQYQYERPGSYRTSLTVVDEYLNESVLKGASIDTCAPQLPPVSLVEYTDLVACVEAVDPMISPRQILSLMRQFYYGEQDWAITRRKGWNSIIPCGVRGFRDPRLYLDWRLINALTDAQTTVRDGDPGHLFAGWEALQCPAASVHFPLNWVDPNFGPLGVTVDLPNYAIATWAGDVGSAAAVKAFDEETGTPADWSKYFGPEGNRASYADLDGDVDGLVLGSGGMRGSCEPPLTPAPSPQVPISVTLDEYEQGSLAPLRRNRIACVVQMLSVGPIDRFNRIFVEGLVRRYGAGVTEFAQFYFARQGVGASGILLFRASDRVAELSLTATRMFGSWLSKGPRLFIPPGARPRALDPTATDRSPDAVRREGSAE